MTDAHADRKGDDYEQEHVHAVYEEIASHFSSTRYKPWPIVERFLTSQPPGSIGLDIGCGNGKYLSVNRDVFIVASDRSTNLSTIARSHAPHSVCIADILSLPHPPAAFDFAISIAVVHHLSTPERRVAAVRAVLEVLKQCSGAKGGEVGDAVMGAAGGEAKVGSGDGRGEAGKARVDGGRALIYVWALEQETSRRGWGEGDEQDVMVPWVRRDPGRKKKKGGKEGGDGEGEGEREKTFHRYYHLYRKGELEEDVRSAGGRVVEAGYEKDNWWVVAARDG